MKNGATMPQVLAQRVHAADTLIETANMNGVDPQAWLADVLDRIAKHHSQPHRRVAALELQARQRPVQRGLSLQGQDHLQLTHLVCSITQLTSNEFKYEAVENDLNTWKILDYGFFPTLMTIALGGLVS